MGLHPLSLFDAQSDELVEARREMWLWAEPIIVDRALEAYDVGLSNRVASNILARKHCRLWRAVIQDQPGDVEGVSGELRQTGEKFGVDRRVIDEVNNTVLEELVDIVLCRYRSSRHAARTFSMVLMSATSCFGALRAVA